MRYALSAELLAAGAGEVAVPAPQVLAAADGLGQTPFGG